MKKLVLFIIILLGVASYLWITSEGDITPLSLSPEPTVSPPVPTTEKKTSLFVPYWSLKSGPFSDEDIVIYFGVSPQTGGLQTSDEGYRGLSVFQQLAGNRPSYLTLRMLDAKRNFAILDSVSEQETLINETVTTAKQYGFEGIVLDLEVSALPFASLLDQISAFNKRFYEDAKKAGLHYAVALYGDTFFRIRPFDVKAIASNSDEIMIMAYDFHKSRGNPGPNFPLKGKEKYGYDYDSLITDFLEAVPPEKLTVIFGYFGYDWLVDNNQNMMEHGDPLSYNQITNQFIEHCQGTNCSLKRDDLSEESYITYSDENGRKHIVWFEDERSVAKKQEFLQTKGISSFSYWAHSYF